ncbi:FimV/HubP family polar landmark protein [Cellvibrio mixtus]|uniref:FimV/HubP family polar landmark protein n=1 Tax=Cellvibrio mixtus TaxID=39650 RepID=UPI000586FBE9|nr:FimV/HubP family polar landmark protein [Cellvibrio mixtus]
MRLRQLVLACGLASLALSSHVSALGLGEVKLKSTLNQPLEAEVKLLDTRDLTAEQILVTLASPADFERNGVDRLFFYTEFQFTVDLEAADGPKVLITSRNPVREPYLNFLIEARWTAGRLLREYTLLMDLPTFEEDGATRAVQSAPVSTPRSTAQPSQSTTQTASPTTSPAQRAPAARASSGSGGASPKPKLSGNDYEVRGNDTLWEIALRARPDSSVSVHQSMMALYKANPDAFIAGNINRLRRGQVLRVPDANEMKSLSKSEAVSQFASASGDSALGAQINASRRTSTAPAESTAVSGRVKLAAPSTGSGAGKGSGANDGSGKALESELATTLEELDKSKAENTELSSRVKDLESQIETMQKLVDVSNEKLRALQIAAEQKNEGKGATAPATPAPATPAPVTPAPVTTAPVEAPVVATESAVDNSVVASSAAAAVPPKPATKPAAQPKPATTPTPEPEPDLVATAIENAPWIGLGVLGLAGVGYAVYRRRKQQENEQQEFEQEDVFAFDETPGQIDEPVDVPDNFADINESSLFAEDQPASAVAETSDVVGEADIYIAYGKLDQAEEMLLNALKKDPESTDIRMKLLEVYAQQQNVSGFDKHYAALLPLAGAAVLARASELRSGISGAGEFDTGAPASEEFALDDFDLDDDLSIPEQSPAPAPYEPGDFDFALDLDDEEPNQPVVAESSTNEFDLDLDDSDLANTQADDLSELSLALDDLDSNVLPTEDVEPATAAIEDEFNFDLDDDLALDEDLVLDDEAVALIDEPSSAPVVADAPESLDVAADDFNLDMNVDDIDLAALDHEMKSLDVDFDDDALEADSASISEFAAQEIAKDQAELGLDLDDDLQLDDLSSSGLNLTDALDNADNAVNFDLDDDDIAGLDSELAADFSNDTDLVLDGSSGELLDFDRSSEPANELADLDLELSDLDSDSASLDDQELDFSIEEPALAESNLADTSVDLELDDEIPSAPEAIVAQEEPVSPELVAEDHHDEDLFSQALSDFSAGSDDLDLNEFSSDEAALADLSDDDMDSELDFLADADEAATKLDLARAYIDMGDAEGAKDILSEVINEGNDDQRKEANELLGRIV